MNPSQQLTEYVSESRQRQPRRELTGDEWDFVGPIHIPLALAVLSFLEYDIMF